ncbi:MAG: PASTA domain-containing protein [Haloplanus sp.]
MARNTPTQLTKSIAENGQADDCGLDRFERNRYFHGKLMTARDMAADQHYHRDRHRAQARHVGGTGAVCGLDVTVTDTDAGGVSVTVGAGYAVDGCGHPIVVDNEFSETFGPDTVDADERVAVWIKYAECDLESVPVRGAEDACGDECAFNRVLEISEIECQNYDEDANHGKAVPNVRFPTKGDLTSLDGDGPLSATDPGLATVAQSFAEADGGYEDGCSYEGEAVFLGVYEPDEGEETWSKVPGVSPRARVYTNDMLYAATARHTADFGNPHQSSLEVESANGAAAVHVEDDRSGDADVTVTSSDSVLTVSVDESAQEINLTTGAALEKLIETRIAPMEQYIMDKSMKYTYRIFSGVASTYDTETAGQIAEKTKTAVDDRVYASKADYHEFIDDVHELATSLIGEVEDDVTEETMARYADALDRQATVLENVQEKGVLALAVAQDEVCEAADWFEQPDMPPIKIPGAELPGGSILPIDPIRPIDPTLPGDGDDDDGGGVDIGPIYPQPIDPTLPGSPTFPVEPIEEPDEGGSGTTTPIDPTLPGDPTTPVVMENHIGQTTETAEETLSNAGIDATIGTQPVGSSTDLMGVGVNEVAEQDVQAGEKVRPGDSVTLTVNEPPTVDRIDVIDEEAKQTLGGRGIETVGQLATAETQTLTDAGLDQSTAEEVKSTATNYAEAHQLTKVEGIGTDEAEALADSANITTIDGLESTPNEQIEASATAAAESGAASEDAAETVASMDLEAATEGAKTVRTRTEEETVEMSTEEGEATPVTSTIPQPTTMLGLAPTMSISAETPDGEDDVDATEPSVSVPDLTGQSKEVAEDALSSAGLTVEVERQPVDDPKELQDVGINEVVSQDPAPGTSVASGETVTVTVNDPPSVTRIEGIGDATAAKLADIGIETVGELARASIGAIQDSTGASTERASEWQSRARLYTGAYELTKVPEIGTQEAEALADAANVTSAQNLKTTSNESIQAAADGAIRSGSISEETAETVKNLDFNAIEKNLTNLGL